MRHAWFIFFLLFIFSGLSFTVDAKDLVKIGVLANNGPAKAISQWQSTVDRLNLSLTDYSFELVPLDFQEILSSVEKGEIAFFLVNSSLFVETKVRYGAVPVATMINSRLGSPLTEFGGVIIVNANNSSINSLKDVKGKRFMAVEESSFGGWQMAYKEFLDSGIDPYKDFAQLVFGGKHESVVFAVLDGQVDAGTVRTDTLERMAAEGAIFMNEIKIINKKNHSGFPFVCSTALYPEWPLARISATPVPLAEKVVEVLHGIKPTDQAARDAKFAGWSTPLDYGGIEELQKALKIGAFIQ